MLNTSNTTNNTKKDSFFEKRIKESNDTYTPNTFYWCDYAIDTHSITEEVKHEAR